MNWILLLMFCMGQEKIVIQSDCTKTSPCPEPYYFLKHDATDVPAIQEPAASQIVSMGGDTFGCSNDGRYKDDKPFSQECIDGHKWTCADKERVLLKSESGKVWCHRLDTGK